MGILQGIIVGVKEIWAHKLRSALTILGVVLGVAALIAMFALVEGMFAGWRRWVEETGGLERVAVTPTWLPTAQAPYRRIRRGMNLDDMVALDNNIGGISTFSPEIAIMDATLRYRNKTVQVDLRGVTAGVLPISSYEMGSGRFIADLDRQRRSRVVVLGTYPSDELFGMYVDPVGRQIRINDEPYRVVGLLKHYEAQGGRGPRSGNFIDWKNQVAFIPLETAMARFQGTRDISSLNVRIDDTDRLPVLIEVMQNVLFHTHRWLRSVQLRSQEEMLNSMAELTGAFNVSLGLIAGISLVVVGIGIMNIMLASINERIREIGIRKAIGARNRDVLVQVITEAVVLSVVGGLLGLAVSLLLTKTIGTMLKDTMSQPVIRTWPLLFSFSVSVVIGIVFGLYPAIRAARLDPIDALRYE